MISSTPRLGVLLGVLRRVGALLLSAVSSPAVTTTPAARSASAPRAGPQSNTTRCPQPKPPPR